jgi:hypothetical protein
MDRCVRSSSSSVRADRAAFPVAVAALLAGYAALIGWDVFHYDWLNGYDAYANSRYADVVRDNHRLPVEGESGATWHNPPLFFAFAALIESHRAMQVLSGLAGFAVVVFAGLIARELFPRSRTIQLAAIAFAALTPVLTRTAVMYHPEPLATALAVAGLYVVVRAFVRNEVTLATGVAAGGLFGLSALTRTWGLALAAAACLLLLAYRCFSVALSLVAVLLALTLPWFVHQAREHGNPVAFNRPAPEEQFFSRRPASFYTSLDVESVFSRPYAPNYLNHLWPVLYTDWWGDYWRYFDLPIENISTPAELPPEYENPRIRQSYVGLVPSVFAIAGLIGLLIVGVRRRAPALLLLPTSIVLLGLTFLIFQISYPSPDGDTIKAAYLLNAVAPLAVCAAWGVDGLRRAGRPVMIAVLALLAYIAVLDIDFLILPA